MGVEIGVQMGVGQNMGVNQTGNYETLATKFGSTK